MKKPNREDYITKNMRGYELSFDEEGYSKAQDEYIDHLEFERKHYKDLVKTLQKHIKIQNA